MEKVKLGKICEVFSGFAFKTFNEDKQGKPVIKIGNIQTDGKVSLEECSYTKEIPQEKYFSKINDIYIALSGATTGKVGIMKQRDFLINQRVGVIRLTNQNIPINYLFYFLKNKTVTILQDAFGAAQPNISPKDILNYEIPLPSLEEQKAIAGKLDKVSELIEKRKTQLEKLDLLIKSRFIELFGDYKVNNKGFACKKGAELFKFSSGKFLPEEKRLADGVPVYGGNGVAWYTSEYLVDYPTVIIGRVGAQCGNIHAVTTPVWITDNAIYIKEQKTNAYTLEFLTELMRMMDFYQYADFSGQPKITQKPLETLDYIIPPIEIQKEYTAFVEQVDKSKFEIQKSLEKLEILKKSLMQQYFG